MPATTPAAVSSATTSSGSGMRRSLVAMVIAKVNGDMSYRGDPARYPRVRGELDGQLRRLGVRRMAPWHTLDEGVAALRVHASGGDSHRLRRDRAAELTRPLRA